MKRILRFTVMLFTSLILVCRFSDLFSPMLGFISNIYRKNWKELMLLKKSAISVDLLSDGTDYRRREDQWEATDKEMKGRVTWLQEMCSKINSGALNFYGENGAAINVGHAPRYKQFYWNREKGLAYCPVAKASSSSWTHNMVMLAGIADFDIAELNATVHQIGRKLYGFLDFSLETNQDSFKLFNESLKFLIVRHPFERLASAYRDKLAPNSSRDGIGPNLSFKWIGDKIVLNHRRNKTINQTEPTWPEFIDFILCGNALGDWEIWDGHWRPATFSCTPCAIKYDVIAKTETFGRDQEYLIRKMGLQKYIRPQWDHSTVSMREERKSLIRSYFKQLSKESIMKLYRVYFLDFVLFGYNHEEFLKVGQTT